MSIIERKQRMYEKITRFTLIFCLLFFSLMPPLAAQEQSQEELLQIGEMEKKAAAKRMDALDGSSFYSNASADFNIHHYRCQWKLDPGVRFIEGNRNGLF